MAGLSTFQRGPKWSAMVNLDVFDNLGPIWVHLDTFGPFQTKINLLPQKDKAGFGRGAFEQKAKNHFLFEMVQKCPDGPKRVPNCQKHLGLPFRTLLDPFGPHWNADKPSIFGHFC